MSRTNTLTEKFFAQYLDSLPPDKRKVFVKHMLNHCNSGTVATLRRELLSEAESSEKLLTEDE